MLISGIDLDRRDVLRFAANLTAVSFEIAGVLKALGAHQISVERVTVPIRDLPIHLAGTVFAQVSDLHMSPSYGASELFEAVGIINDLKPEFLLVTGDYVADDADCIDDMIEPLQALSMPAYAILGNHDGWGNVWAVQRVFRQTRIPLLWNQALEVKTGLWVLGLDDVLSGRPNLRRALADSKLEQTKLLLVHEPDYFRRVVQSSAPVAAQFSGHTHGGQIRLPFPFPDSSGEYLRPFVLPALGEEYVMGSYWVGEQFLYVNRGLGFTGPPMRLNARPEITLFTLLPAE